MKYPIYPFLGHSDRVSALAVSSDSKLLISGSDDRTVRIWEVDTGRMIGIMETLASVNSVAVKDNLVAAALQDGTVLVWDLNQKKLLKRLQTNGCRAIAFSPTSDLLATAGSGILLWDIKNYKSFMKLQDHMSETTSISFSPNGKYLVSGLMNGTVLLWDMHDGKCVNVFAGHSNWVTSLSFCPDGETIISGSLDKSVKVWRLGRKESLVSFEEHANWVNGVACLPSHPFLVASISDDATMRLWDAKTGKQVSIFDSFEFGLTSIVSSTNILAVSSLIANLHVFSSASKAILWESKTSNNIENIAISPDGRYLVFSSGDDAILWNIQKRRQEKIFTGHRNKVTSLVFSRDGKFILTGSTDNTVILWDVLSGNPVKTYQYNTTPSLHESLEIYAVAMSFDSKKIAAGCTDLFNTPNHFITIWKIDKENPLFLLNDPSDLGKFGIETNDTEMFTSLKFLPNNNYIVSGSDDGILRLFNLKKRQLEKAIFAHEAKIVELWLSRDGKYLGSVDYFNQKRVFKSHSLEPVEGGFEKYGIVQGVSDYYAYPLAETVILAEKKGGLNRDNQEWMNLNGKYFIPIQ